jgi:hypothetical protein
MFDDSESENAVLLLILYIYSSFMFLSKNNVLHFLHYPVSSHFHSVSRSLWSCSLQLSKIHRRIVETFVISRFATLSTSHHGSSSVITKQESITMLYDIIMLLFLISDKVYLTDFHIFQKSVIMQYFGISTEWCLCFSHFEISYGCMFTLVKVAI